jgi:hypothetical protein
MNPVPEIRRERVIIPPDMTSKEIQEKYGLPSERAWVARKKGFFVKNYSRKQVIIDPENFDPSISYSTAKRVFWKNFAWNNVAASIKDDLIQEAVTRMYELSGKVKERSNDKYGIGYGFFWVAHNAMLSYLKTWRKGQRWKLFREIQELQKTSEEESF